MKRITQLLLVIILFLSCQKPDDQAPQYGQGLLVLNQGNFTYSNASLTFYDLEAAQAFQNVFYQANGFKLGDIAQSAITIGDRIYVVINNSGKIYGLDSYSLKAQCIITDLVSPRYMVPVNDSIAYVSDLYAGISVVNLKKCIKQQTLDINISTEAIITYANYVFATNWANGDKIIRINTNTGQITELQVIYEPNSMVTDKNGKLWVLSDGGLWSGNDTLTVPGLTVIDPLGFSVEKQLLFDSVNISPSHLTINPAGDTLYFLVSAWQATQNPNYGVYKMSIYDTILPQKPFIPQNSATFYCLNFLPQMNALAVCNAKDFISPGQVIVYDLNGKQKFVFDTGIIPGFVLEKNNF